MNSTRTESLRKQHRLNKPSQFKTVFSNAKRTHAGVFFIRSCNNTCGLPRLGLAFSVRAAGKAVARNRLKRLARESFRRHKKNLPDRDYVVGCRNGVGHFNHAQARTAMNRFWEKESV